jgi:hypothetical protein
MKWNELNGWQSRRLRKKDVDDGRKNFAMG